MNVLRRVGFCLSFCSLLLSVGPAHAQAAPATASVISSCGGASYTAGGTARPITQNPTGQLCDSSTSGGTTNVNVQQVGGTATATGNGATTAGTQRVTLSNDSTGQVAISQATPGTTNGVVVNSSALPTNASTSTLQTTGNSSLSTIATNTTNAGTPTLQSGSTTAVTQATASNLNAQVVGNVAAGATDSGNGVKIACVADTAAPAYTNGQRGDCQMNLGGQIYVSASTGGNAGTDNNTVVLGLGNRADNNFTSVRPLAVSEYDFNATAWDRRYGNVDTGALVTVTGAGAGTTNSTDQTNWNSRGVQIGINLTTVTTATVTINIQGKDAASGVYYTILASTGLATTGFTNMTVYPGAAATTNVSSPQPLPRTWRVQVVITGVSAAVTGTVGASIIN